MNTTEIYTEENRELIDSWLSELGYTTWTSREFPEILREALARDGVLVKQDTHKYRLKLMGPHHTEIISVEWNVLECPTGRTPLFSATVEHLKRREG